MKKQIIYKYLCSYCDKKFKTEEECLHHEAKHSQPIEIVDADWHICPESDSSIRYPDTITIKFADRHIRYTIAITDNYYNQEEFED